jgi:alpha-1,3-glucosyltransferase
MDSSQKYENHPPRNLTVTDIKPGQSDTTTREEPSFPLAVFLQFAQPASQWTELLVLLTIALPLRCFTATWGYSGYQKPPTFGDFEAQRHWMEITTQLPITLWYFHDQDWWPLDYPPLTAYHSWVLGKVGIVVKPDWFALYRSRGLEGFGLKVFMRSTVIFSECLISVPATVLCVRQLGKLCDNDRYVWQSSTALASLLLQPALILIDHGHFQYNAVMLGFFMAALASFFAGRRLVGCVFFVAALGFKQMALFYAPAVTAYLAGGCFAPKFRPLRLLAIAGVTISSFAILYLPLLFRAWHDSSRGIPLLLDTTAGLQVQMLLATVPSDLHPYVVLIGQSLHRIFPFSRGLFEDKVANIWCSIHFSGLYKLNTRHSPEVLSKAALGLTLLFIMPPCLIIFLRPRKRLILLASTACAWGFFLCSYQVHEKNVLLPLLPMTALLAGPGGTKAATRAWVGFANIVSTWTLFHLLIKDELQMVYFPLIGVWTYLLGFPPFTLGPYRVSTENGGPSRFTKCIHLSAYAGIAVWHVLECIVPPPAGKADLWIVANIISGCGAFCLCYLWCLWNLVRESGLMVGES